MRLRETLLSLTAVTTFTLVGCTGEPESSTFDDPRVAHLIESGALQLDLTAAEADPTVVEDAIDLVTRTMELTPELELGARRTMKLRFVGKGAVVRGEQLPQAPSSDGATSAEAVTFEAFNPNTQNQFRIELPGAGIAAMQTAAATQGTDGSSFVADERAPSFSWSNNDDDRFRMYGLNAPVTNSVHKPLVRLGGGCSGTMVGPRHILTAGHCLFDRGSQTWSTGFTASAGRNGSSTIASVFVDRNATPPAGQALWYFTPSQYQNAALSPNGFDFGILVVPSRIGDTTGWMGRAAWGSPQLASRDIFRRGYPGCNVADRIDDPVSCSPHHIYGNAATCELGDYANPDADGWSRTVRHSCDASAGDSGSPLYYVEDGNAVVTAVHTTSLCGTTAGSPCSASETDRPLRATRITPEYLGWISYFRNAFP